MSFVTAFGAALLTTLVGGPAAVSLPVAIGANTADGGEATTPDAAPVSPAPTAPAAVPAIMNVAARIPTGPATAPAEDPVDIELAWTQFASAWDGPRIAAGESYGGKVDAYVGVKGNALGLGNSISFQAHPEFRYGGDPNAEIGLLPVNTALFYPEPDGEVFDLSLTATKRWQSGASLVVGKINANKYVEATPVQGGGGLKGFRNLGVALPPSAIVPASLTGAALTVPTDKAIFRLWVFDPFLQSRRSGLEDPFGTGVGGIAAVTIPARPGGLPGFYTLKLSGTTRTGPPGEILPPLLRPLPGGRWGYEKGTGSISLIFQQFLKMDRDNPGKGIGIFGQAFVADGNPNPLDWSAFIGVSGDIPGRPQDSFGIAYLHYSLSNTLVDDFRPFVAFEDEYGVEGYYTLGLTDWLKGSANVQYINSSIASRGNALIGTFALETRF